MKLTRSDIEASQTSGKSGKEGTVHVVRGASGTSYAIKLFKRRKSPQNIRQEAELQDIAAEAGVTPRVLCCNLTEKFIAMELLCETYVEWARRNGVVDMSEEHEKRLMHICDCLDEVGVVQNDGNPLNLMVDGAGKLFVVDFGFAKRVNAEILRVRGNSPNTDLTLWDFQRRLPRYGIRAARCSARVSRYTAQRKAAASVK